MRTLIAPLVFLSLPAAAVLNDTGQTQCYNGSAMVACSLANTGNGAAYPSQDGRYGRDPAYAAGQYAKIGGGVAGFDFTKVCMSGNPAGTGTCAADPTTADADPWACTKDNHTNLVWSIATPATVDWNDATTTKPAEYDSANYCGYSSGWRAPTRRELLSLVDHGAVGSPGIDTNYFPNPALMSWSSNADAFNSANAWYVYFTSAATVSGQVGSSLKTMLNTYVRLVHNGP